MYKFMIISNYKYLPHGKYGPCYVVNGLLYNNIDSEVKGHQNYTIWANEKHPLYKYCKEEYLGKDLYVLFGPAGRLEKVEVR